MRLQRHIRPYMGSKHHNGRCTVMMRVRDVRRMLAFMLRRETAVAYHISNLLLSHCVRYFTSYVEFSMESLILIHLQEDSTSFYVKGVCMCDH